MNSVIKNTILLTFLCVASSISNVSAQIGTWRTYMSYHDIQQICDSGSDGVFVRASNSLYLYQPADGSITTFDKVHGLSDCYIDLIGWNAKAKRLMAVYKNANIDLVEASGNIINISDLSTKAMTKDKTINSIYMHNEFAYLATGFGVMKVNMNKAEINESYVLDINIANVAIDGDRIFALTKGGEVWAASLTSSLMDRKNWNVTTDYTPTIFDADNSDYDKYYPVISTLNIDGPIGNYFGFMRFAYGNLYTTDQLKNTNAIGYAQVFNPEKDKWTIYEQGNEETLGHSYLKMYAIDVDPRDTTHALVASRTGLYEYRSAKLVNSFSYNNSLLKSASTIALPNKNYTVVSGVKYDDEGNAWVVNSVSPSTSLLEIRTDGTWVSHQHEELMMYENRSLEEMQHLGFDSRGLMWFVNNFYRKPCLIRYDRNTDKVKLYDEVTNQDGTQYDITYVRCWAEDKEGNIWIGTNIGTFYLPAEDAANGTFNSFQQFKVPRNDGTNYADYLLSGVDITSIAIDGGNRKWFGTNSSGVFLISADNMTQLQHFTKENSNLLSNSVQGIQINPTSGEVFFGTTEGLCSYVSDASSPNTDMNKDNVYAYPNPVAPDYTGLITIVGLSYNADVKIVTSNGALVAQGRSNGGTFTWNGCDSSGKRVASGVYNVIAAKQDGSKGTVCKVAVIK